MNKKVLIIEDDKIVRENIAEILELANFKVHIAENGRKGVIEAKEFIPDIIICDILMPELDGYGVLQIVSRIPELELVPFIFLTAKTHNDDLRKGMELGADDYINKPFEESELLRAIDSRLKRVGAFENKTITNLPKPYKSNKPKQIDIKDFELFLSKKNTYYYKKDTLIYSDNDLSNYLFLIKKGLVKTYKSNSLGKELITGFYGDDEYFGYDSFIKLLPQIENSKALTDVELYKINRNEISAIINNNHHVIYSLIGLLTNNIIQLKEDLMTQAYGSVRKKTATTLLNLYKNYPIKKQNEILINRTNLANTIGIAKETLIRTLHDFNKEGLIEITPNSIFVKNIEKLKKIK